MNKLPSQSTPMAVVCAYTEASVSLSVSPFPRGAGGLGVGLCGAPRAGLRSALAGGGQDPVAVSLRGGGGREGGAGHVVQGADGRPQGADHHRPLRSGR